MDDLDDLELQVRSDIGSLGKLTGIQPALAELAYSLCQKLSGARGMPASALARELRQTLELIMEEAAPNDDSGFVSGLSTPDYGSSGTGVSAEVGNTSHP